MTRSAMPVLSHTCRGHHHGQTDCSILLKDGGRVVGYVDYSVYEAVPHIQMIEVSEGQRRRGYATRMLSELQSLHPDQEISWGGLTPDGVRLKEALPTRKKPTPSAPAFARLRRLKKRLTGMEIDIKSLHAQKACTTAAITAYYCLEGNISRLSWKLQDDKAEISLLAI